MKSAILDNFGVGVLPAKGKVKAGATPGLAFGTAPVINVSSRAF